MHDSPTTEPVRRRHGSRTVRLAVGLLLVAALAAVGFNQTASARQRGARVHVDVVENPAAFRPAGDHVLADGPLAGMPAYGDGFVTQGWIYEEGTIDDTEPGTNCEFGENGLPVSCEPAYEPIGTWTCWGHFVGDGAATTEGEVIISTQLFSFEINGRTHEVVSTGFETVDIGEAVRRSITGGTGKYTYAKGTQSQTTLGLHPETFGVRSRHVLNLRH